MMQRLADLRDEMILFMVGKKNKTDKQNHSPYVHANCQ